jgi:hypothetical protein
VGYFVATKLKVGGSDSLGFIKCICVSEPKEKDTQVEKTHSYLFAAKQDKVYIWRFKVVLEVGKEEKIEFTVLPELDCGNSSVAIVSMCTGHHLFYCGLSNGEIKTWTRTSVTYNSLPKNNFYRMVNFHLEFHSRKSTKVIFTQ